MITDVNIPEISWNKASYGDDSPKTIKNILKLRTIIPVTSRREVIKLDLILQQRCMIFMRHTLW